MSWPSRGGQIAELSANRREITTRLRAVGLPDDPAFQRRFPHQLSGGQQQRLAIARALAAGPRVLIRDKITSDLDGGSQEAVYELLATLRSEADLSIVMISHDLRLVARYAGRVLRLDAGRLHPTVTGNPRHPGRRQVPSTAEE